MERTIIFYDSAAGTLYCLVFVGLSNDVSLFFYSWYVLFSFNAEVTAEDCLKDGSCVVSPDVLRSAVSSSAAGSCATR